MPSGFFYLHGTLLPMLGFRWEKYGVDPIIDDPSFLKVEKSGFDPLLIRFRGTGRETALARWWWWGGGGVASATGRRLRRAWAACARASSAAESAAAAARAVFAAATMARGGEGIVPSPTVRVWAESSRLGAGMPEGPGGAFCGFLGSGDSAGAGVPRG